MLAGLVRPRDRVLEKTLHGDLFGILDGVPAPNSAPVGGEVVTGDEAVTVMEVDGSDAPFL